MLLGLEPWGRPGPSEVAPACTCPDSVGIHVTATQAPGTRLQRLLAFLGPRGASPLSGSVGVCPPLQGSQQAGDVRVSGERNVEPGQTCSFSPRSAALGRVQNPQREEKAFQMASGVDGQRRGHRSLQRAYAWRRMWGQGRALPGRGSCVCPSPSQSGVKCGTVLLLTTAHLSPWLLGVRHRARHPGEDTRGAGHLPREVMAGGAHGPPLTTAPSGPPAEANAISEDTETLHLSPPVTVTAHVGQGVCQRSCEELGSMVSELSGLRVVVNQLHDNLRKVVSAGARAPRAETPNRVPTSGQPG